MKLQYGLVFFGMVCVGVSAAAAGIPHDIDFDFSETTFAINTSQYRAVVDLASGTISEIRPAGDAAGSWRDNLLGNDGISIRVETQGKTYASANRRSGFAHAHVTRRGPYLVEIYIENILLGDSEGNEWDGVGEYTLWCQPDRIGMRTAAMRSNPESDFVSRDTGHCCYSLAKTASEEKDDSIRALSLAGDVAADNHKRLDGVDAWGEDALLAIEPDGSMKHCTLKSSERGFQYTLLSETASSSEELVEMGIVFQLADDPIELQERLSENVLEVDRFDVTQGQALGYNFLKGAYEIKGTHTRGVTTRGVSGGAKFTIQNDVRDRRILIEQVGTGWLRGAVLRDGHGNPLPTFIQQNINFPELAKHGERGWGYMTYPVDLKAGQKMEVRYV